MHLNFQIEFNPAPEYFLQYFFFGVIINNLLMGAHMQTYLCAHSHVHLYVWDPEASLKCSSSKNFIYLFGDNVSHYLEPLQLGYCVLRQTQESTSLCHPVLGFELCTTTLTIFM